MTFINAENHWLLAAIRATRNGWFSRGLDEHFMQAINANSSRSIQYIQT